MARNSSDWSELRGLIADYISSVRNELDAHWKAWPLDLTKPEIHEVVGALLARQVTIATQLARSPDTWNSHIGPVITRSMTDAYISLAWILKSPEERARRFVLYGLGQHKLMIEHRKSFLAAEGVDPSTDRHLKAMEAWLTNQRFEFLTEVNVGNWSDVSVREMAEEAGCLDVYRYDYLPWSAATHNSWHHIGIFNLKTCENPLHRHHRVPSDVDIRPDPEYLP